MIFLLDILILAACVGFLFTEGMWSNALRFVNVVLAALLAMNFFEPLAARFAGQMQTFTYFWDFIVLWGLFGIIIIVLSEITNRLSRVKVKFLTLADRIGSGVFAVLVGWVMICFTMTSLHVAPLAREPLNKSFQPEARAASTLSPEMLWLGFVQQLSTGAYARTDKTNAWPVFDPNGEFVLRYATRRAKFESHVGETGAVRIRADQWGKNF